MAWAVDYTGMPTHRDVPWERDARAQRARKPPPADALASTVRAARHAGHPAPSARDDARSTRWGPVATALGVIVVLMMLASAHPTNRTATRTTPVVPVAAAPQTLAPALTDTAPRARSGSLSMLRSRFVNRETIEIWGRTTAPDGATIRIQITASGPVPDKLADVPATAGHFYVKVGLPSILRGRRLHIRARVSPT